MSFGQGLIPQELRVLLGIDVNFHTTAVYESGRGRKVDSKALGAKHVITHQYICLQSVNQVQLKADGYIDLTNSFVNTKDIDCRQQKVF